MNLDAPQYPSPQNHTLFRVETQSGHDGLAVDPSGIDAFGSELPEPAANASDAAVSVAAATGLAARPASTLVRAFAALALVEALVIAGLLTGLSWTCGNSQ